MGSGRGRTEAHLTGSVDERARAETGTERDLADRSKRGIVPEDTYRIRVVSALEVQPDGSQIVYTLETADARSKKYVHSLFLLDPDRGEPRPITRERDDCWSPHFSPDGRYLAFLCSVENRGSDGKGEDDGKAQIFVARSGHRHARMVTRFKEGVEEFSWSPDGRSFVLVRKDPARRPEPPLGIARAGNSISTQATSSQAKPSQATSSKTPPSQATLSRTPLSQTTPSPAPLSRTSLSHADPSLATPSSTRPADRKEPENGGKREARGNGKKGARKSDENDEREPDPIVITRTQIQSDEKGFLDERRSHLWVVFLSGGEPRQITRGPFDDSGPQWSPDGEWIAFVSNRTQDPDTNDDTDIFIVRPDGTGLRTLAANHGPDSTPRWSHRGDRVAFIGQLRPNDYYQTSRLMIVPSQGGEPLDITGSLDTWVSADALLVGSSALAPPQWSSDDATLYVTLDRRGANYLAAVPSEGGPVREVLGGRYVIGQVRLVAGYEKEGRDRQPRAGQAPSSRAVDEHVGEMSHAQGSAAPDGHTHDGRTTVEAASISSGASDRPSPEDVRGTSRRPRLCFTLTDPEHPPEIMTAALDGSAMRRLSHIHDELLDGLKISSPQKIVAKSESGPQIESWLYPPIDFDPTKKYPLILYIHGGPQGFDGDYFDPGLENQIFPANGYAVLRVNYRGSTSYGEGFCRALWGDWHWREYADLMASVDEALLQPWIDGARLGIGGWSYGGIMTVWTVGHTDRFKVGVPERFEVDYLSAFGEDQWFVQYLEEFGSPFEKADLYRVTSPGAYASYIKTPLYLISDEKDGNCPLPQAMQLYQRLRLLGVKTELVIYPREQHVMAEPAHLVDRLQRLIRWFGAHLN